MVKNTIVIFLWEGLKPHVTKRFTINCLIWDTERLSVLDSILSIR
jgi:hypothetical protein